MQEQKLTHSSKKIYTERAIWIGSILGGPLAAGYLIAENFSIFNDSKKAKNTWMISIAGTVLLFGAAFTFEIVQKLPTMLLPIIYCAIASALVYIHQSKNIEAHMDANGKSYSNWRAALIGLMGAILTIGAIIITAFVSDTKTISQNFGKLSHEIVYEQSTIDNEEVKQMGEYLIMLNFFDSQQQKSIYIEKPDDTFILYIPVLNNAWENKDIVYYFAGLRNSIQQNYPNNPIVLKLCNNDVQHIMKIIE